MKHNTIYIFILFWVTQTLVAQVDFNKTPDDDLGNYQNEFQDHFYEALKQKGIENYEKAIEELEKCLNLDNSEAVIYYELGKNYNKLKRYTEAETTLKKATAKQPNNEWYLDELYETYFQQNNYEKALLTAKQLVKFHPNYKEDLAILYVKMKKYDDALTVLDELDNELSTSLQRDRLRDHIYKITGRKKEQIKNLEQRLDNDQNSERNYLALIYRYSENNEPEKAFNTAKQLLKAHPNSELAHLALYKFYLDNNQIDSAITSMKIVFNSLKIEADAKQKVLEDFVRFVKIHPEYEQQLVEITANISEHNSKSYSEMATYYLAQNNKAKALVYFDKALALEPDNYHLIKNSLLLKIDFKNYEAVKAQSETALQKFPSQPLMYLLNAVASNNLQQPKNAINALETGLDYIIDDTKMESDFYKQLSEAYQQLNNTTKANTFLKKAQELE